MPLDYFEPTSNDSCIFQCISSRMQLECSWNTVGILRILLECSWNTSNTVRVQLDCCTNIAPNPRYTLLERNSRAIWQVFMLLCPRMDRNVSNAVGMLYECLERSWNAVGIHFLLECSWKVLSMSKTFQPPTRMDQHSWNVVGMQLEVLERSWNIQKWTKSFHSNCIPVHFSSSVIGV